MKNPESYCLLRGPTEVNTHGVEDAKCRIPKIGKVGRFTFWMGPSVAMSRSEDTGAKGVFTGIKVAVSKIA